MAQFHCRIMIENGNVVNEDFHADSKEDLMIAFRNRGFRPIRIKEETKSLAAAPLGPKKLKLKALILFCRQMATLLRSGVPLIKCFDIIASQTEEKMLKKTMTALSSEVQSGAVLSKAMEKQGGQFPNMLVKMVEVGEVTGDITMIMERMANQYESDSRIHKKVRSAMTYPVVLVGIALAACIFMLIVVVPRFVEIYESLDEELPLLTRIMLGASDIIVHRWYIVIFAVPAGVYGLIRLFRTEKVTRWCDHKKLTLKPFKSPMQKIMCAQMARTLYTLISSGVPIVQAMDYMNRNVKNTLANDCIKNIIVGIQKGKGISAQMSEYTIFPKLIVSMISIGEASGNLEEMLSRTADYYDEELDAAITQLTAILEPIMILLVGLMIGAIVMALYAPLFGMISAMSGSF